MGAGEDEMQIPKRAAKFEWNLNTVIQLITLAVMLAGGVKVWSDTTRDVDDLKGWRTGHEVLHKERLAEVKGIEASYNERLKVGEAKDNEFDRKLDNLVYRVTVAEQSAVTVSSAIRDLQVGQNKQGSDLQVVKEILQRMEAAQRKAAN